MALERFNLDGTSGTTLTAANSGADVVSVGTGATLKFDNSVVGHGATSAAFKGATGTATFLRFTRSGTQTALVVYWNPGSVLPSALIRLADVRNATGTIVRLQTTTGNKFQVQEGAGATAAFSMASVFAVNTWYRLELVLSNISATTGTYKFSYYALDSGTALDSEISKTTGNVGTTNIAELDFVSFASSTFTGTCYYDDIAINLGSTTYIGALPPSGITYLAGPCDASGDVFGAQTIATFDGAADAGADLIAGSGTPTPPANTYLAGPCDASGDVATATWAALGAVTIVTPPNLPGTTQTIEVLGEVTVH